MKNRPPHHATTLKRALNLPMMVLYGLGTTIGAGIYALTGEIAGVAGYGAPAAFLLAALLGAFTAGSFAELAARYPRAAGAALYVQRGFGRVGPATLVGLLVVAAGVVSTAALLNGFAGYLEPFVDLDRTFAIIALALLLGAIAAWGIVQSVVVAALITLIEVGGLLAVIGAGAANLTTLGERWSLFVPGFGSASWAAVLPGVILAFYAYIGFEDMVDVAEEVVSPQQTLPRAILLTLLISTALYMGLMVTALLAMTPAQLSSSSAPLAMLFEAQTGASPMVLGGIALIAIVNGALIQIVMASRVLYGLASRAQLPAVLARVSPRTRTPLVATALTTCIVIALALFGRLATLAATTSLIILTVFAVVNLALWRIKAEPSASYDGVVLPRLFPLIGFVLSSGFVVFELVLRIAH